MANLTSSGQISLDDIIKNRTGGASTDVSLKDESETFASGSEVAGSSLQTTARANLIAAPYAISEFYNADFNSDVFSNISITTVGGGSNRQTVDTEDLTIGFDADPDSGDFDVLLIDSGGTTRATETRTGEGSVTFSNLNLDAGTFTTRIRQGFSTADGDDITHFDKLTGGSTSISNSSQFVDAADEAVSNVTLTPSVSTGVQTTTSIGTTVITGGDGGNISATNTSGTTFSLQNTPGVLRFDVTHIGTPGASRNSTTSTATATVSYNRAINDVASLDTSNSSKTQFNSGDTIRIRAISEGITSSTNMRIGFSTSNSGTGYSNVPTDRTITTSQFVRDTELVDTSHTLTSGTSLATFFPKANYTSGDANVTAGSSFSVAPAFSYSATGNQTINIDQTADFGISSLVGNGASIVVASSPNIGGATLTSNGTTTMNPDDNTGNGTYTISYTGTANFSQSNNASNATLTVRPKVSISSNNGAPKGLLGSYSSGLTPTGTSNESFTVTASTQGANLSYSWTLPSNFTDTAGGGSGDNSVTGFFSGGSEGIRQFALTVTGNGVASTQATEDVTYTGYTQQSISNVAPTSGNFRRGVTTLNVTFTSRNVAFAKILLIGVSTGTANKTFTASTDSLDSATADALESQSHSATVTDVGQGDVGTYTVRVLDASDDNPSTDASGNITILDKEPTTPGAFNDSTSLTYVGSLALDWNASSYAYQYQIFKSSGDSDSSYSQLGSNQSGTSVTISQTNHTTSNGPFYYKVRAINFAQGPLSTETSNFNSPVRIKVQPTLSANSNQPDPVLSTIFSTTNNTDTSTYPTSTTMAISNQSDNSGLGFSYALSSNTAGCSISNASTATPTISAGSGAGSVTVTLTVSADNQSNFVHSGDAIAVHYMPKIYNVNTVNVAGNGTPFDQITFSYNFQGKDVNSSRLELYDSEDTSTVLGTYNGFINSPNADSRTTQTSSGTVTLTSLSSNFSRTQSGNYVIKIILFGGAGQTGTSISAFTSAFDINVVTAHTINTQQLLGVKFGYNSLISAADTTPQAGNTNTTLTVYAFGNIIDGRTIYTSTAASSVYDGDYHNDNTRHFFSDSSNAFIINDSGVVSSLRSRTANLPTLSGTAVSTATDDITIRVTGNTEVTRTFGVNVSPSIGGSSDANANVSSQGSSTTTDISLKTIFGASLSSGTTYTVKVKGQNFDNKNSSFTGTQTFSTDAAATNVSGPADYSQTEIDGSTNNSPTKQFTITNPSGNSTVTFAKVSGTTQFNVKFAALTTGIPSSFVNSGNTITLSQSTNVNVITQFEGRSQIAGQSGVYRLTVTNNSASDSVDVTLVTFDEGDGGEP